MEYENYSAKIFSQQEPGDLKVRAIPEKRENQAYSIGKEESCENPRNLVVIKGAKQILIMLTFVGLGLYDEEDKTLKGLEAIRDADLIYVEFYTSPLGGIQNITSTS